MRDELLDQVTCPHADAGWEDNEWTCWDCGLWEDADSYRVTPLNTPPF